METDNEIMREDRHAKVYDFKSQKCERDANPLATEKKIGDIRNVPQLHELMDVEDPRNARENQSEDSIAKYTIPVSDIKLSAKETTTYTKKSVAECELPKLIVCLKETSYHAVKDICIDEGLPSLNKIVIENSEVSHNGTLCFSNSGSDVHSDLIKGMVDSSASISKVVKPLVEYDTKMDVSSNCPSEILMEEGEGDYGIVNVSSSEKFVPQDKLLARELETGNSQPEASNFDGDEGPQQSDQDTSKEAEASNSKVPCIAEESNCEDDNEVPLNGKMESQHITIDPGSSAPAKSVVTEDPQNSDSQQVVRTTITPSLEDGSSERLSASSRSLFSQHGQGESSFSALDMPSALVTYSGPITNSGNISLRSDSSTTSNRSFAFPILQSDWNSSPVRMAKADGRHYRKHQRWKLSLLCCRF